MRAVRFGSYSMCATLAGTPSLSLRRKSIRRYARLWPPPWWRVVTLPCALRPPLLCSGRISDFSGVSRVISAKSETLEPRRPGVVGLYLRIPMGQLAPSARPGTEHVDVLALGGERDDRALGVLALAVAGARALPLPGAVQRVHADDLHPEHLLHGDLDLGLVRVGADQEGVLLLVEQRVALLGHHRREQDVARVGDHLSVPSARLAAVSFAALSSARSARLVLTATGPARNASREAWVNSTTSLTSTS